LRPPLAHNHRSDAWRHLKIPLALLPSTVDIGSPAGARALVGLVDDMRGAPLGALAREGNDQGPEGLERPGTAKDCLHSIEVLA
jgi:hypothetical protein